jgi:phage/plasmid-like protein (TIGR03299 family)
MGHNIEEAGDGRATFVAVEEHGWHTLGTLSKKRLTVAEGLELAHLANLEYHLEPIAVPVGDPPRFISGGDLRAAVRRNPFDRDEWQVLGAGMTTAYTMHTPEEAFGFTENLIDAGKPLAAMGSINGGRNAFAAFFADDITIGGVDQVRMYLNCMTGFVGNSATYVRSSAIRVVCANTYNAVMGEVEQPTYVVRHVGEGLDGRIEDARAALDIGYRGMEAFQKEAEALLDREVSDAQWEQIVAALLPDVTTATDAARNRAAEGRAQVTALYNGATVENVRGTAWGALNAYTEWLDWTAGNYRTAENRMVAQITPGSVIDQRRVKGARLIAKQVGLVTV